MGVILLMIFCAIAYIGFIFIKGAFEKDDDDFLKRNPPSTKKDRFQTFVLGLIVLFVAWLFYMVATDQI
jgi:hypothetical protein